MPDQLSSDEKKALEQLQKACEKHGRKPLHLVQSCALLKKQLALEAEQKEAEQRAIARSALSDRRLEALGYVIRRVNAIQNEGTLLVGALMKASGEYDQILQARASKPIFMDILTGLALAALPHLGAVSAVVNRSLRSYGDATMRAVARHAQRSSATGWDELMLQLGEITRIRDAAFVGRHGASMQKFADTLDAASKDLIEAVKNPLAARADVDAATAERLKGFQPKNQILTDVVRKIQKALVACGKAEGVLHRFIVWYDGDPVPLLESKFKAAGLDAEIAYKETDFDKISDLILYDMLRAYVKAHVTFTFKYSTYGGAGVPKELPENLKEDDVSGLNGAQRTMIWDKFGLARFSWNSADRTRPPLFFYTDLIRKWGAKVNWVPHMQRVA
jgi:hypothetical protein